MKKRDLVITWHSRNRSRPRVRRRFFANLRHLAGDDARSVDVLLTRSHAVAPLVRTSHNDAHVSRRPRRVSSLLASRLVARARFAGRLPADATRRVARTVESDAPSRFKLQRPDRHARPPRARRDRDPGLRPAASVRGTVARPALARRARRPARASRDAPRGILPRRLPARARHHDRDTPRRATRPHRRRRRRRRRLLLLLRHRRVFRGRRRRPRRAPRDPQGEVP